MQEGKTIGQLMEEMRQKAGAQNYHGHDYMDLQRLAENTRHMIIFDVLTLSLIHILLGICDPPTFIASLMAHDISGSFQFTQGSTCLLYTSANGMHSSTDPLSVRETWFPCGFSFWSLLTRMS